ncbi:MAG: hypothetical protein ACP5G2_07940 [Candidatus Bipolaricaulaceae bacterium]
MGLRPRTGVEWQVELAIMLWALGDLPAVTSGLGELALGPAPWLLAPLGKLQHFWTPGLAAPAARLRLLEGPWFLWLDLPPPRLALGRAPGYALVALVRGPEGLNLAWELTAAPWLSAFGSLGEWLLCGLRARGDSLWGALVVRGGELSLWAGVSGSF